MENTRLLVRTPYAHGRGFHRGFGHRGAAPGICVVAQDGRAGLSGRQWYTVRHESRTDMTPWNGRRDSLRKGRGMDWGITGGHAFLAAIANRAPGRNLSERDGLGIIMTAESIRRERSRQWFNDSCPTGLGG